MGEESHHLRRQADAEGAPRRPRYDVRAPDARRDAGVGRGRGAALARHLVVLLRVRSGVHWVCVFTVGWHCRSVGLVFTKLFT
jgi:hypothetical protein